MWPLLLKFVGEQDSGKTLRQGYHMLPLQPRFRHHVPSNFDFFNIFLHYLTKSFKTRANCYFQSQLTDILCNTINVARDV